MSNANARYMNETEIHRAIERAGGCKAGAYFISNPDVDHKKVISPCALFRDIDLKLWVNNLPIKGYSHTAIWVEELNRKAFVFKYLPVEYQRAVFWPKEKDIIYVDLKSMEDCVCRIVSWENRGYYSVFEVQFQGEDSVRELRVNGYMSEWVFLDPETP